MYQRLFQITIVLFVVVLSIAILLFALNVLMPIFSQELLAESGGISAGAGGITDRQLGYMIIAASIIVAGLYLFFRRRRFRR